MFISVIYKQKYKTLRYVLSDFKTYTYIPKYGDLILNGNGTLALLKTIIKVTFTEQTVLIFFYFIIYISIHLLLHMLKHFFYYVWAYE